MARARTQKRQLERDRKKLDEAKIKLAAFEPGFTAEKPIAVDSASQIEPHVRGMSCPACGVGYQVREHVATKTERIVRACCPQCGRTPNLHFIIRSSLVN